MIEKLARQTRENQRGAWCASRLLPWSTISVARAACTLHSRARAAWLISVLAIAALLAPALQLVPTAHAADTPLQVAIQTDLPPYVMHRATDGLEVDIVRSALAGHTLEMVQMPYAELQEAVTRGRAAVAVAVKHLAEQKGVHYSRDFITFVNAAITKKAANLKIADVAALAGHRVLAWQDAYLELGPVFEKLYAPGGPERSRYSEFGDQVEQVRAFWAAPDAVAVIDRAVFRAFTEQLGHSMNEVVQHDIFPPVTTFRVAFADPALRDAFDRGIAELCRTGAYRKILERYQVELPRTVCDG